MPDTSITFETKFDPEGFDKGVKNINSQLENMRKMVSKTADSTSKAFGSESQGNIDRLSSKLNSQADSIAKVSREVDRLSSEYNALSEGDVNPKSLETLTSKWNSFNNMFQREMRENDKLLDKFIAKDIGLENAKSSQGMGLFTSDDLSSARSEKIEAEIDLGKSTERLEELRVMIERTRSEMDRIKMNPESSNEAMVLAERLSNAKDKLSTLSTEADKTEKNLKRAMDEKPINKMSREVGKMSKVVSRVPSQFSKIKESMDSMGNSVRRLSARITSIAASILVFNVMRSALRGTMGYVRDLVMENDKLASSLETIKFNMKVAFQPIYEAILPSLEMLIGWLEMASASVARFTSMLFGTTYKSSSDSVIALEAQRDGYEDVSEAAKKSAKETKKNAKESTKANKQLQSFDKLNKMQSKDDSLSNSESSSKTPSKSGGANNLSLGSIEPSKASQKRMENFIKFMSKSMDKLSKLTKPAVDSLKALWEDGLKPLGEFAWVALADFYESFLVPVGTWVMEEGFPRFVDAITDLLANMDWDTLNEALERMFEALAPFAIMIGEGLLWFWEEVIIPLAGWALENLIPGALDLLAASIELLTDIVEASKPTLSWLWENIMLPMAEWAGDVVVSLIESLTNKLKQFSSWARENQETMDLVFSLILGFLAGMLAYKTVHKIVSVIGSIVLAVQSFGGTVAMMLTPVGIAAIAVGALAAAFIYIGSNWGKLNGAQRAATILGGLATAAIAAGIAIAAFHASWSVGVAAAVIVGSLAAIGIAYSGITKNAQVPGMSSGGGASSGSGGSAPTSATSFFDMTKGKPKLPKLAKGGLIPPRKPRQVIVGDNMVEDEIVSPVSTMQKAMAEVLAANGSGGQSDYALLSVLNEIRDLLADGSVIEMDDREFGRAVQQAARDIRNQTGMSII